MEYKIRRIRKERGLTQAAVVEAANISQPYLSQLENGSGGVDYWYTQATVQQ